jgi:putative spermidine/putrescine transport system ATP-binding protein
MQLEIKRIQRALHVTTIFVTHDQSEAMALSDRILVFDGGRIQQDGAPLEIYLRPRTEFVARFVGDSNLLRARIEDRAQGIAEVEGLGRVRISPAAAAAAPEWVTLLLRPEVFHPGDTTENRLTLAVEEVVQFGDSALVIGRVGQATLRARIAGRAAQDLGPGAQLPLAWTPDAAHLITT